MYRKSHKLLRDFNSKQEKAIQFNELCDIEKIEDIGGSKFHGKAIKNCAMIIRAKTNFDKADQACLIHFHGGTGISGSYDDITDCCRYAIESNVTVISPEYRLAPEHKHPAGVTDGYAAIKWVLENCKKLKIDPKRIAVAGQSGGGYICSAAVKILAVNKESSLIKFFIIIDSICTGNIFIRGAPESELLPHTVMMKNMIECNYKCIQVSGPRDKTFFSNILSTEIISTLPPCVILTSEFGNYRQGSDEMRDLFRKHKKLLAYGCSAG